MKPRERNQNMRMPRERPEFDQRVLDIRRTARVVAGGRRFTFRATVVIGNHNGKVALGMGKGIDVAAAVDKAVNRAKKRMLFVPLTKGMSISHGVEGKAAAARVILKPASLGRGLVAGGPVRVIADMAGIKNLTGKILGRTPNKLNNAKAVMEALGKLKGLA